MRMPKSDKAATSRLKFAKIKQRTKEARPMRRVAMEATVEDELEGTTCPPLPRIWSSSPLWRTFIVIFEIILLF